MGLKLKQALASNRVVRVFCLGQICHPKLVEMLGMHGGWDGLWLDQEHAGISIQQIEEAARAGRAAGLSTFVRLNATDYATVMRPLEAGAGGIMAAMVKSGEQAEQIVRWAKFGPRGCRGVNGSGYDGRFGTLSVQDYFKKANAESFVAIQIEHIDAINDIDAIAAVKDIDVLFLGPADLSQSMGLSGDWDHPDIWKCIEKVAAASKKHNVPWAILPIHPGYAKRSLEMGCKMLSIGIDTWAFYRGLGYFQQAFAEYFTPARG
jgi:2-dehydro-3-deoxyglucarate aldolase/4-hydroxy-2-oxoheptanedioate aldolase